MDAAEAVATCRLARDAIVIAMHMYSLDHATVSRGEVEKRRLSKEFEELTVRSAVRITQYHTLPTRSRFSSMEQICTRPRERSALL
jgi:hypothetical protein